MLITLKKQTMSKLKTIIGIILVTGLTSYCFANVPIKLQITGPEFFNDFSLPSGGYTAELTGATSTGEYEWDISTFTPYGEIVNSQGSHATIRFTSAPSASEGRVTVKILCKTYYMDGNQRKSESAHLDVTWKCPRVSFGIEGNAEVLEGLEETYTGWFKLEDEDYTADEYEWKIGESQSGGKKQTRLLQRLMGKAAKPLRFVAT